MRKGDSDKPYMRHHNGNVMMTILLGQRQPTNKKTSLCACPDVSPALCDEVDLYRCVLVPPHYATSANIQEIVRHQAVLGSRM